MHYVRVPNEGEPQFAAVVARVQTRTGALRADAPSRREIEVSYLAMIELATYPEIGLLLELSPRTVATYVSRLALKLGLSVVETRRLLTREFWAAAGSERL